MRLRRQLIHRIERGMVLFFANWRRELASRTGVAGQRAFESGLYGSQLPGWERIDVVSMNPA